MKTYALIWLMLLGKLLCAQDSTVISNWKVYGYVKDLQSLSFNENFSRSDYLNLVHNRMNLKWTPAEAVTLDVEVRNRFFWGDAVTPYFKEHVKNRNEAVNMSATWFSTKNLLMHSDIERLWTEYHKNSWNIRAGRQRINWALTNTWNPNDIFNTYNFLDFDYEERAGSDAVKFHHSINDLSNLEVAVAAIKNSRIAAAKYFTNYKGFDLQLISGVYQNSFTAGIGWAGSIADAGFKGEAQLYAGNNDSTNLFNLTIEADYIFKNGWYVAAGILYNQIGIHGPVSDWSKINFTISPQNLMPSRWNILLNGSKTFTPLFNGSTNIVYSPQLKMLILFPAFTYNLQTNLDLDLVWQSFFAELNTKFQAVSHTGFVRLKWNF